MPADRLLTSVLRAFQRPASPQDLDRQVIIFQFRRDLTLTVSRILSSTITLLTTLSNPLNVTLLTSQFLAAPAIWDRPDGLRTSLRIISVFNSAALTIIRHENDEPVPGQRQIGV